MPNLPETRNLRLRVFLRHGEMPQWTGELLMALDRLNGVALQLVRLDSVQTHPALPVLTRLWRSRIPALAAWSPDPAQSQRLVQWDAAAGGGCDVTLVIDAGLRHSPAQVGGESLQWALVDGKGRALCPQFPLLQPICAGTGIELALNQCSPLSGQWHLQRRLHLGVTPQYGRALRQLSNAVLRLVQQGASDWMQGIAPTSQPVDSCASAGDIRVADACKRPWWTCLQGDARASWARMKARILSEYWRIGVIDAPVYTLLDDAPQPKVRWLTQASTAGYWADPFGLPGDPHRLACEYFDERAGVGVLEVLRLDTSAHVVERTRLAVGADKHASFPNVFELGGRHLGIAETLATRECVLHEVDVEGQWRPLFPLLRDVAAADPALFSWEGRLWLAYTDTDLGALDNLCLCYADQLEGPWTPHANNPVKIDITGARMAGGLFQHKGKLYRPAQNCSQTYGGAVVIHQITELTPQSFSEVAVRTLTPDVHGPCPHGLHTLNAWGERTLVDGKRHGVNLIAMWRNLRHRLAHGKRATFQPMANTTGAVDNALRHVLVYVPHLRTGGGEISMLRLAAGLAAAGLQVDLVVHSESTRELEVPRALRLSI